MPVWNDLSVKQKAGLIKIFVNNGIYNLDTMRDMFDKDMSHISASNTEFMRRLNTNDTKVIHNPDGTHSSIKMSYSEADDKTFIYPEIQEIDGKLVDYSGDRRNAMMQAVNSRDTIQVSKPVADWYTNNNYKSFYPNSKIFAYGGEEFLDNNKPSSYKGEQLSREQWKSLLEKGIVSLYDVPKQYRD